MVFSLASCEQRAKRYAQITKDSYNTLLFFQIGYILGKIKPYGAMYKKGVIMYKIAYFVYSIY